MDWLDAVVALVVLASAVHGLRLGALVQVLSFGGFVLGLTLGALLADAAVTHLRTATSKTVLSLVLVIGLGIVLGVGGRLLGGWAHGAVARFRLGGVDNVLGVGVAVIAALLAVWLVANELAITRLNWLSSAINRSAVVRAEDNVMPPLPNLFSRVQGFLSESGFPPVFSELEPTPVHVATPTSAYADRLAATATASTVKVLGQACGYVQEGSGFVAAPRTVVTNAHVVAGEHETQVVVDNRTYPATVVLFDPTFDIAVLHTTAPVGPPLRIDPTTTTAGTKGAVIGYPEDGPLSVGPAAVAAELDAQGRNIYNEGTVTRKVYEVDADVEPGNSGGPLLGPDGEVIGVVFSRSTAYNDVGYALASPGVLSHVQQASGRTAAVSTGSCVES